MALRLFQLFGLRLVGFLWFFDNSIIWSSISGASGEISCCAHAGLGGWKDNTVRHLIQPSGLDRRRLLNKNSCICVD